MRHRHIHFILYPCLPLLPRRYLDVSLGLQTTALAPKVTQLPLYVVLTECQNLKSFLQLLSTTTGPQLGDSPPLCPGIVSKGYPF